MKLPLFPLDLVLFPGVPLPLHIFEPRYRELFHDCMDAQIEFGVVRAREEGVAAVGCTASIGEVLHRYSDGRFDVMCHGRRRFEVDAVDNSRPYLQAEVHWLDDEGPDATRSEREACVAMHFEVIERSHMALPMPALDLNRPIAYSLASLLPTDLDFQQQLLAMRSEAARTQKLQEFYQELLTQMHQAEQPAQSLSSGPIM